MTTPSGEDLPYAHIATNILFRKFRIRLWEWPESLRRRVMLAAMDATDQGIEAVRMAAIKKAGELLG